jgi:hypothetical protein
MSAVTVNIGGRADWRGHRGIDEDDPEPTSRVHSITTTSVRTIALITPADRLFAGLLRIWRNLSVHETGKGP